VAIPAPASARRARLLEQVTRWMDVKNYYLAQGNGTEAADNVAEAEVQIALTMEHIRTLGTKDEGAFEFLLQNDLLNLPPEGLLFFDEWNRADMGVIKVFFTLLGDRRIHSYTIPEGIQVVCAMNPSGAAYSVSEPERDPAFRRRICFLPVNINAASWVNYAQGEGDFHPLVVEYIKSSGKELHDSALRDAGKQYPSPAGWEAVSDLCKTADKLREDIHANRALSTTMQGLIGRTPAVRFLEFVKNKASLITPSEIVYEYSTKGRARKKVLAMLEEGRSDVISEVCTGVAVELMTSNPDPQKVKGNLGRFMGDLPSDAAVSFIVSKLTAAAEEIGGKSNDYIYSISQALSTEKSFERLFTKIAEAQARIKQSAGSPDALAT